MASGVLELRAKLSHGGRHCAACQDLEFGSLHVAVGDSTNTRLSTVVATVSECFCIKNTPLIAAL
jgi:hypothetical protein